ncbi:basic proline-rich protein-like [Neofelis nebulosa]|uniref:basic proline-rich protein-like n=1 Tax=Neofelis nebulosa TaxID=61452 RepID=UPI00272D547F|nr:basic proline-rich protein-like [Neofelis nebulosa]
MGEPPQTLKSSAHANPPTHHKPEGEGGVADRGAGTPWAAQGESGKWKKRSPPTPTHGLGTTPSALPILPHCGGRGEDCGNPPPYPRPRKFSGVTPAPLRLHLPRLPGARKEKGLRAGGAPSRDLRAAGRRQTPGASPRSADWRLGKGGGSDGRPGLRGPDGSGQVQRPSSLGSARLDPPWDTRPAPPVAPTPPGTRASGPPTSASAPEVARRALLTPHYPRHRRRAAPRPRAPCRPPRPPRPHHEPGPHLCQPPPLARSLRLCRRRSEPHTHRYTQPSDVTEPSARPRHCGDTRLPADAAAVSGRPGESEGGGEGEGKGTEPAAAPRARARRRRCHRPLATPSLSGTRAPSGLLWLLGAPPSPRRLARAPPPPRRAPGTPGLARRLGGWRTALSAVHPAQTGSGCLGPPPPRPRPTRCSVVTGQTRGRPGRSAAARLGERGQGGRAVHCARPQQPAGRRQGPPGRAPPPEVRHGRPSPREAAAGPPRPGGSRVAAALQRPRCGPRSPGRAGAAPRPHGASRPQAALPAACAPPHLGGPRLAGAASAQTPSPG